MPTKSSLMQPPTAFLLYRYLYLLPTEYSTHAKDAYSWKKVETLELLSVSGKKEWVDVRGSSLHNHGMCAVRTLRGPQHNGTLHCHCDIVLITVLGSFSLLSHFPGGVTWASLPPNFQSPAFDNSYSMGQRFK